MKRIITSVFLMLCYLFVTTTVNAFTRVYVKLVTDTQVWSNVTIDAGNIVKTIGAGGDYPDFTGIDFNPTTGLNLKTGDEVWVAKGTYTFSKQLPAITNGISIYGGFEGTETAVSQRAKSDLDGNGMVEPWEFTNATKFVGLGNKSSTPQTYRMMILNNGKTLDGITISDIYYSNSGSTTYAGGGEIQTGALIRNSIIQNITTVCTSNNGVNGGGLYINRGGMDGCLVENCMCNIQYTGNGQTASGGGVVLNGGSSADNSACTGYVVNSIIRNCTAGSSTGAKNASGGGVYTNVGGRVENCVIYNNSAIANGGNSQGGGIIGQIAGDTYMKGNYFVNLTVVNNFSNGYPSFFPASNYASAYNCIVWQNGNGGTTASPTFAGSSIRISATTTITGYPYLDYMFYNSDPNTPITNGTNNKANPFNAFTAKVADNSSYPGFFRPTTFVGSSSAEGDITNIRQANWTLSSISPVKNKGVAAPTNTITSSLQVASPYVIGGNTFAFSPSDLTGATIGTQYQLGAYGRLTYKLNIVVGSNGSLFEADGITTSKSEYPVFANDTLIFYVVPANGYIISSATIGSSVLTPDKDGKIKIPSMASDATLSLSFNPKVSTFSKNGSGNWSTATEWTYAPVAATDLVIANGELIIDQTPVTVNSITVNPGAKLTLNSGKILTTGSLTLQSSSSGTATFVDDNSNGGLTVTGTSTVQQYLAATRNWYNSSPVSGATTVSGYTVFQYNEAGDNNDFTVPNSSVYWKGLSSGSNLTPGRGYITVPSSGSATVSFTGTLNSGNSITVNLTKKSAIKSGFNLIGNPFASHYCVSKTQTDAANALNTIWYRTATWDSQQSKYIYTFQTCLISDDGSTLGTPEATTNIVPPMQSFWVKTTVDNSTFTFNGIRSHQNSNPLKVARIKDASQALVRMQVSNGIVNDEAVIYSNANARNDFDSYDALKMNNNTPSVPEIYTLVNGQQTAINGLNSIPYNVEIPLGFTTGVAGHFSIKATQINNLDADTQVLLKDYADINNPVTSNLSDGSNYSFNSGIVNNNISRFTLIFRSPSVSTGLSQLSDNAWITINNRQINVNGNIAQDAHLNIFNMLGQKILSVAPASLNDRLNTCLSTGIYIISIKNAGKTITKKIIVD